MVGPFSMKTKLLVNLAVQLYGRKHHRLEFNYPESVILKMFSFRALIKHRGKVDNIKTIQPDIVRLRRAVAALSGAAFFGTALLAWCLSHSAF